MDEDLVLSGNSTVEYGGSSSEYESDCCTDEYPSFITRSTGDSDDSDGSSLEGSGNEEVIEIYRDDGTNANGPPVLDFNFKRPQIILVLNLFWYQRPYFWS